VSFAPLPAAAETTVAATPAAGYVKLVARGGSDTALSLPLVNRSVLLARVMAVGPGTVTLAASGLTGDAFAPAASASYYAQLTTGALEGLSFRVLASTAAGVVTLEAAGESLTHHPLGQIATGGSGDLVRIRKYWTISDVWGAGEGLVLDAVAEPPGEVYLGSDAILISDPATPVAGKPESLHLAFVSGAGWRNRDEPTADAAGTVFVPGVPFTVRRQRATAAEALVVGYVATERLLVRIPAVSAGEDRDVAVAWAHPGDRTLAQSGLFSLVPWLGGMEASPDALNVRDALLELDVTRRGFALPAARRFHYQGTGWFESETPADSHTLKSGGGYVLRLRAARGSRYWVQPPPN
jgi:uncharacterized protein (TIGR02597 family)